MLVHALRASCVTRCIPVSVSGAPAGRVVTSDSIPLSRRFGPTRRESSPGTRVSPRFVAPYAHEHSPLAVGKASPCRGARPVGMAWLCRVSDTRRRRTGPTLDVDLELG